MSFLGNSCQGHAFIVFYRGELVLQPMPKTVPNTFDYMGMLVGLSRLPGEKNAEYRHRLFDVYVHRAGSHEVGLINGITRELGLEQFEAITIQATSGISHHIIVNDTTLELNAATADSVYQLTINLYKRDQGGFYLSDLVETINTSPYFSATLSSGVEGHTPSVVLLRHNTRISIDSPVELLSSTRHKLQNENIVKGTLKFSGAGLDVFATEKASEAALSLSGDFYVDYTNGLIVSYSKSMPNTVCTYAYSDLPAVLMASPVILFNFDSELFKNEVFDRILQSDGQYANGLPGSEATDYINELLSAKGLLWGD